MNIFVLDQDIQQSARFHNNSHVVKMPTEIFQMLSFNIRFFLGDQNNDWLIPNEDKEVPLLAKFSKGHFNHPCSVWMRESQANIDYSVRLAVALEDEWRFRFNHDSKQTHKAVQRMCDFLDTPMYQELLKHIPDVPATDFAQALPEQYRHRDPVVAYREYYIRDKQHLANWGKREMPSWYKNISENTRL